MKKLLFLVTIASANLMPFHSVQAQNPVLRPRPVPNAAVLEPVVKPVMKRMVIEAPRGLYNPRLGISAVKIRPNFKINEQLLQSLTARRLVNSYADELEKQLNGKSVGYAFVVRFKDTNTIAERAGGVARRAPDPNPRAMTVDDKLNIASVSKTITAATLLKLMAAKNLSVDTPAYTILPPDWAIGLNFKTVTVRELLTHLSGVRFPAEVTLENLRSGVAAGIKLADKPVYEYNNSNFGLMRVLISRLASPNFNPTNSNAPYLYGMLYMTTVAKQVFEPAGLVGIQCQPISNDPAQCYQFPSPIIAGTDFGDMTETNASRGWNMSARELATFGSKLFFSGQILPQAQVDTMIKDDLGIYGGMLTPTVAEFGHNGYYPGKGDNNVIYNPGELNSVLYGFSNGISVGLLLNSQHGPGLWPQGTVRQAMITTLSKN